MGINKAVIGILAHVDAGKTTLSESLLYLSGVIREPGRVDHKNAYLDTEELERTRGITIFSKQALFTIGNPKEVEDLGRTESLESTECIEVTLLDTPGHIDFSAEMERVLQVLDYGILVINGADGVQGHTLTLWKLLRRYRIPVFLFINKMDLEGSEQDSLLKELETKLDERCLDFGDMQEAEFYENIAMCEERVMDSFLEKGRIEEDEIARLIKSRKVFPCYFGSALKLDGVENLLEGLGRYISLPAYPEEFGARVFKITRDKQDNRLTHMKITGGCLKVKEVLVLSEKGAQGGLREEKVNQIRVYSGSKYEVLPEAPAGTVCAVVGLEGTYAGQGLGIMEGRHSGGVVFYEPMLEPLQTRQIRIPPECDVHVVFQKLRQLEEEAPHLHMIWKEQSEEIHVRVMGEVETEVLKVMVRERYGIEIDFGERSLIYKETICEPVIGVGHFEPLRHYAEVHVLLEPLERGSGLLFEAQCSEDMLSHSWQKAVLSHLQEKKHRGVLTGSEITDIKITLIAGRAHTKHTEGGDFRQAANRAVRQGLRKARSMLLEQVYEFRLEIPALMLGRALSDIQRMQGQIDRQDMKGEEAIITGIAPVATMEDYQRELISYSRGMGRLFCIFKGYEPCHNEQEVLESYDYDPESDLENPTGSIFCAHGAGFPVSWDKVEEYQHVDSGQKRDYNNEIDNLTIGNKRGASSKDVFREDKELEEIFTRTYGSMEGKRKHFKKTVETHSKGKEDVSGGTRNTSNGKMELSSRRKNHSLEKYLLVDGYNIIFAWEELKELAERNLDAARMKLMDILCNYQGYRQDKVILVFDAHKVKANPGTVNPYHNIHVVYTKEAETADQYIEKVVHEIGKKYDVMVATSDAMEQMIIWGDGGRRLSAQGLREEIESMEAEIRRDHLEQIEKERNYPLWTEFAQKGSPLRKEIPLQNENSTQE